MERIPKGKYLEGTLIIYKYNIRKRIRLLNNNGNISLDMELGCFNVQRQLLELVCTFLALSIVLPENKLKLSMRRKT